MLISKRFKLDQAVSDDGARPALNHVLLTKRCAVACNANILAVVPILMEAEDSPGLVTPAAFAEGRRKNKNTDIHMKANGSVVLDNGQSFARVDEQFPNFVPLVKGARRNSAFVVGLDVSLLSRLAEALGTEKVELSFDTAKKAIFVRPINSNAGYDEGYGLLMPFRTPGIEK